MKIFIFIALLLTRRRLHSLRWDSSLNKSSAFFVALFFYTTPLPPFSISGHHLNSDNKKRNWKRKEAAFFWSEFKQHLINIAFVFLEPHFVSFRSKTLLGFISVIRTFLPFCSERVNFQFLDEQRILTCLLILSLTFGKGLSWVTYINKSQFFNSLCWERFTKACYLVTFLSFLHIFWNKGTIRIVTYAIEELLMIGNNSPIFYWLEPQ